MGSSRRTTPRSRSVRMYFMPFAAWLLASSGTACLTAILETAGSICVVGMSVAAAAALPGTSRKQMLLLFFSRNDKKQQGRLFTHHWQYVDADTGITRAYDHTYTTSTRYVLLIRRRPSLYMYSAGMVQGASTINRHFTYRAPAIFRALPAT